MIPSMWLFHNFRPDLLPAIFLSAALTFTCCACQSQSIPPSVGTPDDSLDHWLAQDTAQFLCQYTRGPFPNWSLLPQYAHLLAPDEAQAIEQLSARFVEQKSPSTRPKYKAIAQFIANHTSCIIAPEQMQNQIIRDKTGAILFQFIQTSPVVPNIPDILSQLDTGVQNDEIFLVQQWLNGFEKAYTGDTKKTYTSIVVAPTQAGKFILRSNVLQTYANPLLESDFWSMLDQNKFDDAFEFISIACVQQSPLCESLKPFWDAAQQFQKSAASSFHDQVVISNTKMTSVALTPNTAYTAVELDLQNLGSSTFSNIVFKTDEVEPQYCELQAERSKRNDNPITLEPHQTTKAWCALDPNTRPWTKLSFVIATHNIPETALHAEN